MIYKCGGASTWISQAEKHMSVPFHIMTGMRDGQVRPNESFGHTFSHSPFHCHKTKVKLNIMHIISEGKK